MENNDVINDFRDYISGKNVLFITTKEPSYIRNSQELRLLEKDAAHITKIASEKKSYFFRLLAVYFKILFLNPDLFDVVFIGFSPQLVLPLFKWKFKNKPIIIDFFISVYDTFVSDRKKFSKGSILARFMHKLDKATLKLANEVIVDTKADKSFFSMEFDCPQDKFSVLYLEADETIYYARGQMTSSPLEHKYVVFYFGSILPLQGIDVVLNAIRLLKDDDTIFFQIVGPIPAKYAKPIQNNVEYIEWLSQEQLAEYIAAADICLAGHFSATIDKANRTIPGKAYIYKAMHKKMILGDTTANHEIFTSEPGIEFVPVGNADALADLIKKSSSVK